MKEIEVISDVQTAINIVNIERGRDIPGGASIALSTLVNGGVVTQATPLSAPTNGVRSVCKQGLVLTGSTATSVKLTTGSHHFKVGDFVGTQTGGIAYAITAISASNGVDTLTIGTAINTPTVGGFIYEMAAQAASNTSAFKNVPVCVAGKAFTVNATDVIMTVPAYIGCSVKAGVIGSAYLALLKNVDEVSY